MGPWVWDDGHMHMQPIYVMDADATHKSSGQLVRRCEADANHAGWKWGSQARGVIVLSWDWGQNGGLGQTGTVWLGILR